MRYLKVDDIQFHDVDENDVIIKDIRELENLPFAGTYELRGEESLDEIAYKIWGKNQEGNAYKLFDANREIITEMGFDLTRVKRITIPKL